MSKMACLSDFHLGDNKSALNNGSVVDKVVKDLITITGGTIETLVLNGDVWEQCIPAGTLEENPGDGICASVGKASRQFFRTFFDKISIGTVVWVPGNHDLSLWKRLSDDTKCAFHTPPTGVSFARTASPTAQKIFDLLFQGASTKPTFKVSYPIYLVSEPFPNDFPYVLFTHGHLLDSLVQGRDAEAKYVALKALGCPHPSLPDGSTQTVTIQQVAAATDPFTLALWKEHSTLDYTFWNFLVRRLSHPGACPMAGKPTGAIDDTCHPSSPRDGQFPSIWWFLETAIQDPTLPTPVGSLRSPTLSPAFNKRSCSVFGHDHLGTRADAGICGVPFNICDSGGWTVEFDGHVPHSHVLVWPGVDPVPTDYFVSLK
jgi:hypothetical protein